MKISGRELIKKREGKKIVFLVTGGTGFIGSHTAVELLKRGYRVIMLCRPSNNVSARERVEKLLKWFRVSEDDELSRLEVMEGFLDRSDLGLTDKKYSYLAESIDEIVHCAASTAFSEKKRDELEIANIKNLENLLKLAGSEKSKCYYFHHVSTVYVAGKINGTFEETPAETRNFFNVYEETKCRGEQYVLKFFPNAGLRVNIYRSSIVYGDSETGRSTSFNAVYYPVKIALFLKDTYKKDIFQKGGKKAAKMGVKIEESGKIYLPVRMEKRSGGAINLIPINYFTDAFIALLEDSIESSIFHIVSNSPKNLNDIIRYFGEVFNIHGFRSVPQESFDRNPHNALELLFNSYIKMYGPYINDTRKFGSSKAAVILGKRDIKCPEFDLEVFAKCMNYAISVNWRNPWK